MNVPLYNPNSLIRNKFKKIIIDNVSSILSSPVLKSKKYINIIEVSPRDGLQNEKFVLNLETRKTLIDKCTNIGLNHIEVGSFVNPKLVPQMANTDKLLETLNSSSKNKYSVLIPSIKNWTYHTNIKEIVLFIAASETFNKKNINCDISSAFERFKPIFEIAKHHNIPVRGSISTCFKCPYEGEISKYKVLNIVDKYLQNDVELIDIADTIGNANSEEVYDLFLFLKDYFPIDKLTAHFHDTNGKAIENVKAALDTGVTTFHSSIGGLGGCPFSPKRSGNLATEKLVEYLENNNDNYSINTTLKQCKEVCNWINAIKTTSN
jgi:hydroxymethylglutaryl-CoA lyase